MEKVNIINEQYQRPDTLSRIVKNQGTPIDNPQSQSDRVLLSGAETFGKNAGEALKKYMGGKLDHSLAEKKLKENLTIGELTGRATDKGVQERTAYKDALYGENLQELDVLNQTEMIAANDFYNTHMSKMAEYANMPKEAMEENILSFYNGIKEKYKDKPAYANGLITRFAPMATDLMENYTKNRQAVLQAQAEEQNVLLKTQALDSYQSMISAAGADINALNKAEERYIESLNINNRAKNESPEAFMTAQVKAQTKALRNGNINGFKAFQKSQLYLDLPEKLREEVDKEAKAYDKKMLSQLDTKKAQALIALTKGDTSLYNKYINEDVPETGSRLSGQTEGQELLVERQLAAINKYDTYLDRQEARKTRQLNQRIAEEGKQDKRIERQINLMDNKLANNAIRFEMAETQEEKDAAVIERARIVEEGKALAGSINDPYQREYMNEWVNIHSDNRVTKETKFNREEIKTQKKEVVDKMTKELKGDFDRTVESMDVYNVEPKEFNVMTDEEKAENLIGLQNVTKKLEEHYIEAVKLGDTVLAEDILTKIKKIEVDSVKKEQKIIFNGRIKEQEKKRKEKIYNEQNQWSINSNGELEVRKGVSNETLEPEEHKEYAKPIIEQFGTNKGYTGTTGAIALQIALGDDRKSAENMLKLTGSREYLAKEVTNMLADVHSGNAEKLNVKPEDIKKLVELQKKHNFIMDENTKNSLFAAEEILRLNTIPSDYLKRTEEKYANIETKERQRVEEKAKIEDFSEAERNRFLSNYQRYRKSGSSEDRAIEQAKIDTVNLENNGVYTVRNSGVNLNKMFIEDNSKPVGEFNRELSLENIIEIGEKNNLFDNMFGNKKKTSQNYASFANIKDEVIIETYYSKDSGNNIVLRHKSNNYDPIILNNETMKELMKVHRGRQEKEWEIQEKKFNADTWIEYAGSDVNDNKERYNIETK